MIAIYQNEIEDPNTIEEWREELKIEVQRCESFIQNNKLQIDRCETEIKQIKTEKGESII